AAALLLRNNGGTKAAPVAGSVPTTIGSIRRHAWDTAQFCITFVVVFGLLLVLHRWSLGDNIQREAVATVRQASTRLVGIDSLLPAWPHLWMSVIRNPLVWLLVLDGACIAMWRLRDPARRGESGI